MRWPSALLLSTILVGGAIAQEAVFRMDLSAPVLMTTPSDGPPDHGGSNEPLLVQAPAGFPANATVGESVDLSIPVTGGVPGYNTFAIGNAPLSAPAGIDFTNQRAYGTFELAGDYSFYIGAQDSSDPELEDLTDAPITISVQLPLEASYSSWNGIATVGTPLSIPAPSVGGGLLPYTFSDPEIPGLSVNPSTGATTYDAPSTGILSYTLVVTDSIGREDRIENLPLNAAAPVALSYSSSDFTFAPNQPGSIPAPSIGGGRGTKAVEVVSGALPSGMTFSSSGAASGTVTASASTGDVVVRAVDVDGRYSPDRTLNWTVTPPAAPLMARVLVVGSGAGGARGPGGGGGGGAGGVLEVATFTIPFQPGVAYTISVGSGGAGAPGTTSTGTTSGTGGEESSIIGDGVSFKAGGGGAGGSSNGIAGGSVSGTDNRQGGSGGGGTQGDNSTIRAGGSAGSPNGKAGGPSAGSSSGQGGGGGGSGAATTTRNGGSGTYSVILGEAIAGGGGGGHILFTPGNGGSGGGGKGGTASSKGGNGTEYGSGGGGVASKDSSNRATELAGGNGFRGVVIIEYESTTSLATGGSIGVGSNSSIRRHTFTGDGIFTPNP